MPCVGVPPLTWGQSQKARERAWREAERRLRGPSVRWSDAGPGELEIAPAPGTAVALFEDPSSVGCLLWALDQDVTWPHLEALAANTPEGAFRTHATAVAAGLRLEAPSSSAAVGGVWGPQALDNDGKASLLKRQTHVATWVAGRVLDHGRGSLLARNYAGLPELKQGSK